MNLAETILGNPELVGQVAESLGLGRREAQTGIEALLPGLGRGLQKNAARPGGLESLLGALRSGQHQRYVDEPQVLGDAATRADGNAVLGHVFGSKDVSRNVAGRAAQQSGLQSDVLKKMLPMVAAMAMGALSKQQQRGGGGFPQAASPAASGGSGLEALSGFLDADGDGSALDDVLSMARKFL